MPSVLRLALTALLATGCIPVIDFDPVGMDSAISASWTIDGEAATEASCRELLRPFTNDGTEPEIPRVRVTFLDGERAVAHSGLMFSCSEGSFDTDTNRVVRAGTWTIRLEAIDPAGRVIAVGPAGLYTAEEQSTLVLDETPFLSGIISASVLVGGTEPSETACRELGVASLQIVFDAEGGLIASRQTERCTAGGIGTRVQPGGAYTVRLRTLDDANQPIAETEPETLTIEAGQHAMIGGGPIELTDL
jgi:hypothetical protein